MIRKVLVLLVLLIAGGLWYWQGSESPAPQSEVVQTTKTATDSGLKSQPEVTPVSEPDDKSASTPRRPDGESTQPVGEEVVKMLLSETRHQRYSEDPFIEAISISMELVECDAAFWGLDQAASNPTRLDHLKKQMAQHCTELKARYPNIQKMSNPDKLLMVIHPSSMFGEQLSELYMKMMNIPAHAEHDQELADLNKQLGRMLLSSDNAQLVGMAKWFTSAGIDASLDGYPFQEILQTEHGDYIHQINQMAIEYLACELNEGIACMAHSAEMLHRCRKFDVACGLNFLQWFDQVLSPGMQADVLKLLDYYRDLKP